MLEIIKLILLTMLPFLELRASIPYGVFNTSLPWIMVFVICVLTNILLAPLLYLFLDKMVHVFFKLKVFEKFYHKSVEKTQKKIHKYVEKYGVLGLALFIGVPLPGSGVYSGALGAYVLGFSYKEFLKAAIIGVLIAGVIVTAVSLVGGDAFNFMLKKI